ncbi:hypothetical protein [Rhodococcus koreensis]|uniref:hypothetical protein n=1 Tax=Rhodococcus koreensis TaxID=99653 RepID=UPI003671791A
MDGFGQRLTASGTTPLSDVEVDPEEVASAPRDGAASPAADYAQLILRVALGGIARAACRARAVAQQRLAGHSRQADFANHPSATTDPTLSLRRNGWPTADTFRLTQNYDSDQGDLFQLEGRDPYLDGLQPAQVTETDRDKGIALIGKIQDHVIDNAYTVPLLLGTQIFAVALNVHDFRNGANSTPCFYDTWTEKK